MLKKVLMAAVAAMTLAGATNSAMAVDRNHDGIRDNSRLERIVKHDRYWKPGYRSYIGHNRVFVNLRNRGYVRFVGNPYFYHDRYVVRSYNRFGKIVFVEVNPYTGGFIGEFRI